MPACRRPSDTAAGCARPTESCENHRHMLVLCRGARAGATPRRWRLLWRPVGGGARWVGPAAETPTPSAASPTGQKPPQATGPAPTGAASSYVALTCAYPGAKRGLAWAPGKHPTLELASRASGRRFSNIRRCSTPFNAIPTVDPLQQTLTASVAHRRSPHKPLKVPSTRQTVPPSSQVQSLVRIPSCNFPSMLASTFSACLQQRR